MDAYEKVLNEVKRLSLADQGALYDWLHDQLYGRQEEAPAVSTSAEVVATERRGKLTLQLQYRSCGKPTCKNDRHGPYWYGYYRQGGKLKSLYLGKQLPSAEGTPAAEGQAEYQDVSRTADAWLK